MRKSVNRKAVVKNKPKERSVKMEPIHIDLTTDKTGGFFFFFLFHTK